MSFDQDPEQIDHGTPRDLVTDESDNEKEEIVDQVSDDDQPIDEAKNAEPPEEDNDEDIAEDIAEDTAEPIKITDDPFTITVIVVKPEKRKTSHIMSLFEMTEYISIRATQISQYNNCMVDTTGLTDPIDMAKRELMMRKCPLVLRRHVGYRKNKLTGVAESYFEYWNPSNMQFAKEYPDVLL
jgi:DNA-directed RNA polymerase subunit K/omega